MYILAKRIEDQDGYTIHGITDDDKVQEAWGAGGGSVFSLDCDDPIVFLPYPPDDYDDETDEVETGE